MPRTPSKTRQVSPEVSPGITRDSYAAFIGQIDLTHIWLRAARVVNHHGPQTPKQGIFNFSSHADWEPRPGGFRAFDHSSVRIESADTVHAEIDVTFALDFDSEEPMTPEIFALFGEVNLPVNTWPYLREFIATTMGRMGWTPFTIPALKRGTQQASRPRAKKSRGASTTRRKAQVAEQPLENETS